MDLATKAASAVIVAVLGWVWLYVAARLGALAVVRTWLAERARQATGRKQQRKQKGRPE